MCRDMDQTKGVTLISFIYKDTLFVENKSTSSNLEMMADGINGLVH